MRRLKYLVRVMRQAGLPSHTVGQSWLRSMSFTVFPSISMMPLMICPFSICRMIRNGWVRGLVMVTTELKAGFDRRMSNIPRMVFGRIIGFVGGQKSKEPGGMAPFGARGGNACRMVESELDVAVARSPGRRNGISASNCLATAAISSEFVETITRPQLASIAAAITWPSNGLPQSWRRFLLGTRVEPPLAGIRIKRLINPKAKSSASSARLFGERAVGSFAKTRAESRPIHRPLLDCES